ncbi:MAG TPA: ABC transporter ATP-binding protein [Bacteroidales bacterium]|nr:ABC transporter ATP-binding protein [Bacteroidales bacterium]
MKDIIKIFRRFLPRYKKDIVLNVVFNFLGALFGVFSFISMIPVLRILFKLDDKFYQFLSVDFSAMTLKELGKTLENNLYAYLSQIIQNHSATRALIYLGLFLILMVLFKTGFSYFASFFMVNIRNGVVRDIRNDIYRKAVSLPISFFTEERKGDIISRMTGDVAEIEVSVMHSLEMLFKNPVVIMVSIVTMILMSWQLTLFVFLLFPVAGIIIGRIGRSLRKSSLAGQNKMGEILTTIEETLSGLRIIKAFNAEPKMKTKFTRDTESYRHTMNRLMRRNFLASPVSEFLGTIVIVIVMWFGGHLILSNVSRLDAEEFLVYLVVFYSIINPTKAFSQAYYNVQKGLASLERIDKVLNARSNIIEKPDALPVRKFERIIEYRDVHFRYNKEYVLKDINLEIEKGKTIALVGQSGSGKSTLVDLLPRFYDVEQGEILLDEMNIKDYKIHDLRGLMGIVNQDPILFNDSFFNNIAFGIDDAKEEDVISAAKVANAHEFIIQTENGYYTNIGDRGSKLSGGQRQRISIARAVLKNPPVLILDEATSALDTESERLVQEAITNLMRNRTSIIIAHRLSTIVHADEICVVTNGKIVERGKHEELIKLNGEYKRFYDMQNFS